VQPKNHCSDPFGPRLRVLTCLASLACLGACSSGPDYVRPVIALPPTFMEAGDWTPARPQSAGAGGAWWTQYGDPELDALVDDANAANQSLQVAEAQYRQANAALAGARAGYAPTLGAGVSASRARTRTTGVPESADGHSLTLGASWEPDLWGQVRRRVEAGAAAAQASADDLAAARLSVQATLVQDYLQLRVTDRLKDLLARTVDADRRVLALTRRQRDAGVASPADVALAESQLQSVLAQALDLGVQRTALEHAIATLIGRPPARLRIVARPEGVLGLRLPDVPPGLPSQLLERRPDIAAAERRTAAANAGIGIARAANFPSLVLSASGGYSSPDFTQWFDAPGRVWSLGAALAATLFDGGARRAQNEAAKAAYDAAAAQYKQTVLAGMQEVEDNLAALRVLARERRALDAAVASARVAERVSLAQYRAGTATYLAVVAAQTLALGNERSAVQTLGRQLVASAALVKSLGGGWQAPGDDPATDAIAAAPRS
jgi:NodT family efflux transporter outer membrane factor (OMF) lipoprotein